MENGSSLYLSTTFSKFEYAVINPVSYELTSTYLSLQYDVTYNFKYPHIPSMCEHMNAMSIE